MTKPIVVAVDGPAASGKGTLARRLARHYGLAHLNSGSLYRLAALNVLRGHADPNDETAATAAARAIDPSSAAQVDLSAPPIAETASIIAAFPSVRAELLDYQRRFATSPPGDAMGAVIDGRDIGTVVCPAAQAKLYIDALPERRAHRRWLELSSLGQRVSEDAILADIRERDARDRGRTIAPLKPAADAILLDTSNLDIDAAFAAALELVNPRIGEALAARHRG